MSLIKKLLNLRKEAEGGKAFIRLFPQGWLPYRFKPLYSRQGLSSLQEITSFTYLTEFKVQF